MPQVAGIRLNIGLAYFRQNEFLKAIPPFESVVRDQPDALQPRYLLGLCYFFAERWADAANTLEPLWAQESGSWLSCMCSPSLPIAPARRNWMSGPRRNSIKAGEGSPEFHLFMGKAHLNLRAVRSGAGRFSSGGKGQSQLDFCAFQPGIDLSEEAGLRTRARDEFLKDAAVEPDLALQL